MKFAYHLLYDTCTEVIYFSIINCAIRSAVWAIAVIYDVYDIHSICSAGMRRTLRRHSFLRAIFMVYYSFSLNLY
jgi:hypothetical protein